MVKCISQYRLERYNCSYCNRYTDTGNIVFITLSQTILKNNAKQSDTRTQNQLNFKLVSQKLRIHMSQTEVLCNITDAPLGIQLQVILTNRKHSNYCPYNTRTTRSRCYLGYTKRKKSQI